MKLKFKKNKTLVHYKYVDIIFLNIEEHLV